MVKNNDVITIDFSRDFYEIMDELYWKDMHFEEEDGLYIHDTNQGLWYAIEDRYWYANYGSVIENGKTVDFKLVNEDFNQELEEQFYEQYE